MKKILALLLAVAFLCSPLSLHKTKAVEPSHIRSRTAVLMDADTGQVLYDKGMHRRVYPASTTKILTALLAVENLNPDEVMTVSESALAGLPFYGAHIALVVGEELTVEDAIFAMMLPSANDASNVLAEYVAGSLEAFAEMMTERAHQIGAVNTNFTNAHGLHCEDHFTTAYDMALITRHAMENEEFRRYFAVAHHLMPPTNKNVARDLHNFHYMLVPAIGYFDPTLTGGKVGFTQPARHTMSTTASRDGRNLVCVVMYSTARGDKFADTIALLDFGFDEFTAITIPRERFSGTELPVMQDGRELGYAIFEADSDFSALIHTLADPDELHIQTRRPDYYDYDNPSPYTVRFELVSPLPFVPNFLGMTELSPTVKIRAAETYAALLLSEQRPTPFWPRALTITGIALVGVVVLVVVLEARRKSQIKKRRIRRLEQLVRRQQAEQNFRF